jgi:hypothetical protein
MSEVTPIRPDVKVPAPKRKRKRAPDVTETLTPTGPATARAWKEKQLVYLGQDLRVNAVTIGDQWCGLSCTCGPRFRLAEGDLKRMEAIMHRFSEELFTLLQQAAVIDTQASPRPSFLRLVVDNTAPAVRT